MALNAIRKITYRRQAGFLLETVYAPVCFGFYHPSGDGTLRLLVVNQLGQL
jgi:hypothetical protein